MELKKLFYKNKYKILYPDLSIQVKTEISNSNAGYLHERKKWVEGWHQVWGWKFVAGAIILDIYTFDQLLIPIARNRDWGFLAIIIGAAGFLTFVRFFTYQILKIRAGSASQPEFKVYPIEAIVMVPLYALFMVINYLYLMNIVLLDAVVGIFKPGSKDGVRDGARLAQNSFILNLRVAIWKLSLYSGFSFRPLQTFSWLKHERGSYYLQSYWLQPQRSVIWEDNTVVSNDRLRKSSVHLHTLALTLLDLMNKGLSDPLKEELFNLLEKSVAKYNQIARSENDPGAQMSVALLLVRATSIRIDPDSRYIQLSRAMMKAPTRYLKSIAVLQLRAKQIHFNSNFLRSDIVDLYASQEAIKFVLKPENRDDFELRRGLIGFLANIFHRNTWADIERINEDFSGAHPEVNFRAMFDEFKALLVSNAHVIETWMKSGALSTGLDKIAVSFLPYLELARTFARHPNNLESLLTDPSSDENQQFFSKISKVGKGDADRAVIAVLRKIEIGQGVDVEKYQEAILANFKTTSQFRIGARLASDDDPEALSLDDTTIKEEVVSTKFDEAWIKARLSALEIPEGEMPELGEEIGRGGTGVVYRVKGSTDRIVKLARKRVLDGETDFTIVSWMNTAINYDAYNHARIRRALPDAAIGEILWIGSQNGVNFAVFSTIPGAVDAQPSNMKRQQLTDEEILSVFIRAGEILVDDFHKNDMAHGDVKPGNIIFTRNKSAPDGFDVHLIDLSYSDYLGVLIRDGATTAAFAPESDYLEVGRDTFSLGRSILSVFAERKNFNSFTKSSSKAPTEKEVADTLPLYLRETDLPRILSRMMRQSGGGPISLKSALDGLRSVRETIRKTRAPYDKKIEEKIEEMNRLPYRKRYDMLEAYAVSLRKEGAVLIPRSHLLTIIDAVIRNEDAPAIARSHQKELLNLLNEAFRSRAASYVNGKGTIEQAEELFRTFDSPASIRMAFAIVTDIFNKSQSEMIEGRIQHLAGKMKIWKSQMKTPSGARLAENSKTAMELAGKIKKFRTAEKAWEEFQKLSERDQEVVSSIPSRDTSLTNLNLFEQVDRDISNMSARQIQVLFYTTVPIGEARKAGARLAEKWPEKQRELFIERATAEHSELRDLSADTWSSIIEFLGHTDREWKYWKELMSLQADPLELSQGEISREWGKYIYNGRIYSPDRFSPTLIYEFSQPFESIKNDRYPRAGRVYSSAEYHPVIWRIIDLEKNKPSRMIVFGTSEAQFTSIRNSWQKFGWTFPIEWTTDYKDIIQGQAGHFYHTVADFSKDHAVSGIIPNRYTHNDQYASIAETIKPIFGNDFKKIRQVVRDLADAYDDVDEAWLFPEGARLADTEGAVKFSEVFGARLADRYVEENSLAAIIDDFDSQRLLALAYLNRGKGLHGHIYNFWLERANWNVSFKFIEEGNQIKVQAWSLAKHLEGDGRIGEPIDITNLVGELRKEKSSDRDEFRRSELLARARVLMDPVNEFRRQGRAAERMQKIVAAQGAGVVDTTSRLVIFASSQVLLGKGPDKDLNLLVSPQLNDLRKVKTTPLGPETFILVGPHRGPFDVAQVPFGDDVRYHYIAKGDEDASLIQKAFSDQLSELGLSGDQKAKILKQFSITIVPEPVLEDSFEYNMANLQAMLSMARVTARVKSEHLSDLSDVAVSFFKDMLPAVRAGEVSFVEALQALKKFDERLTFYPKLGMKVVRIPIDQIIAFAAAARLAVGAAA